MSNSADCLIAFILYIFEVGLSKITTRGQEGANGFPSLSLSPLANCFVNKIVIIIELTNSEWNFGVYSFLSPFSGSLLRHQSFTTLLNSSEAPILWFNDYLNQ